MKIQTLEPKATLAKGDIWLTSCADSLVVLFILLKMQCCKVFSN